MSSQQRPDRKLPQPQKDLATLRAKAVACHSAGQGEQALRLYRKYLSRRPQDPGIWTNLGILYRKSGDLEAAVLCHRRALDIDPSQASIWSNLGNVLKDLDLPGEAVAAQQKATQLAPENAGAWHNLSVALRDSCAFEESIAALDRAIALPKAQEAQITWDRAVCLLHLGRYREAWPAYEARWRIGKLPPLGDKLPRWRGEDLKGRRILVTPEQGFGDSLLAARFLPPLKARGAAEVVLLCKKPLVRLFETLAGVDRVIAAPASGGPVAMPDETAELDFIVPILSLPGLLDIDLETLPAPPRLTIPQSAQAKAASWLSRIPEKRLKVGIVWSGSVTFENNAKRSTAIEPFLKLGRFPGVQLVSLQKGPKEADLIQAGAGSLVLHLGPMVEDFAETAAVIDALDLVIMTDSSVAHLTGTLGKPLWNLLNYCPYWLYGTSGQDCAWYPSMRLFRQPSPGDWVTVFHDVEAALQSLLAEKGL